MATSNTAARTRRAAPGIARRRNGRSSRTSSQKSPANNANPGYSRRPGAALHQETIATSRITATAPIRIPKWGKSMAATRRPPSASASRATSASFLSIEYRLGIRAPRRTGWWTGPTFRSTSIARGTRRLVCLDCSTSWSTGLPLERADPTIPWTSEGQHVDRQESTGIGGGLIVITTTWTWKLTLEPDAGQ